MRTLSLVVDWLRLPLKCKFGAHTFDPDEMGCGFDGIDYYCRYCQKLIRSVPFTNVGRDDLANLERIQRLVDEACRAGPHSDDPL